MATDAVDTKIREELQQHPVLVTGADGFVGSHLVEELLRNGARVHVLVRATSSGMLHNIGALRRQITVHRADLSDKQAVLGILKVLKSDGNRPIIFHLGAQAHVGECWARPYETLTANVTGTVNLLQSIVDLDLDIYRLDTAGSSEEYGNVRADVHEHYRFTSDGALLLDERSPVNPQSVYATSKVAADFLTRNYHAAYGLPTVVTRMFNNYGPRQNPRFVTGTIITQALSRDFITLGYMGAKRDFCFVKDGARGHICATLFGTPGDVYVYGSGRAISIADWYNLIIRLGQEAGIGVRKNSAPPMTVHVWDGPKWRNCGSITANSRPHRLGADVQLGRRSARDDRLVCGQPRPMDWQGGLVKEFYAGRPIVVTGGAGFIGSALVEHLVRTRGVRLVGRPGSSQRRARLTSVRTRAARAGRCRDRVSPCRADRWNRLQPQPSSESVRQLCAHRRERA
jgi:dTDP-glucose 4,6-dehydratase